MTQNNLWEEKFDEKFYNYKDSWNVNCICNVTCRKMKNFIQKAISQAVEEERKRLRIFIEVRKKNKWEDKTILESVENEVSNFQDFINQTKKYEKETINMGRASV